MISAIEKQNNARRQEMLVSVSQVGAQFLFWVLSEPTYGIVDIPEGASSELSTTITKRNAAVTAYWEARRRVAIQTLGSPNSGTWGELARSLAAGTPAYPPIQLSNTEGELFEAMLSTYPLFVAVRVPQAPLKLSEILTPIEGFEGYDSFWTDDTFTPPSNYTTYRSQVVWGNYIDVDQPIENNTNNPQQGEVAA